MQTKITAERRAEGEKRNERNSRRRKTKNENDKRYTKTKSKRKQNPKPQKYIKKISILNTEKHKIKRELSRIFPIVFLGDSDLISWRVMSRSGGGP